MLEVLSNYFLNPSGIYALSALLLIIIIYFLKKKTTITRLPTMMFLLKEQGKKRYKWFPRFPFNLLFLIYALIAILLALSIMQPFYNTNASNVADNVIHIIDNSASMQAGDRFEQAIEDAKNRVGTKTTIIVTSPKPTVLLEGGSFLQARNTLSSIKITDATTPLKESILFINSQNYESGAIHIFSDFLDNSISFSQIQELLGTLASAIVVPHIYSQGENTLGFVDAKITKTKVTLLVRNFREYSQTATIQNGEETLEITIPANDIITVSLTIPQSNTEIKLLPEDDVSADNVFYFAAPPTLEKKLLYITQKPYAFTTSMLDVLDFITYDTYAPPGAVDTNAYDAYIIEDVDPTKLLPSNINEAIEQVKAGGVLIIKMGNQLRKMEVREEYPFTEILTKKRATIQFVPSSLTESLTAASEEEIFPIALSPGATVLLESAKGEPIIAYKKIGQGAIVYYGITDAASGSQFKQTYAYPILFQRIFKDNFHIPSQSELQKETGEQWIGSGSVLDSQKKEYELPTTLANAGFYNYGGATFGVNLLSITESQTQATEDQTYIQNSSTDSLVKQSLLIVCIIAALVVLALEVLYLRKRGDY